MKIEIQLLCLVFSFIYGLFIAVIVAFNKIYFKKRNNLIRMLASFLLTLNLVLLYILVIYNINQGIFHIYFILLVIMSFLLFYKKIYMSIKRIIKKKSLQKK